MAQTSKNVVYSKPAAGGAVWSAPAGTAVPTDATTALDKAFVSLGYISEDGVAENGSINVTTLKAYGGTIVLAIEGGNDVTYTFTSSTRASPSRRSRSATTPTRAASTSSSTCCPTAPSSATSCPPPR